MTTDIRISVEFWDHPKTIKLQSRLGLEAVKNLQILWMWAAKNRPDGELSRMDNEDIEIAARWSGESGLFIQSLVDLNFLEVSERNTFTIHDWRCHNPWAAEAATRSDKARFSRLAYICPEIHSQLINKGQNHISKAEYENLMAAYKKSQPVNGTKQRGKKHA